MKSKIDALITAVTQDRTSYQECAIATDSAGVLSALSGNQNSAADEAEAAHIALRHFLTADLRVTAA